MTFISSTESWSYEMESNATWMSKDSWASKHGASNLNLWYDVQHHLSQNNKPWWDDSDKKGNK